MERMAQSKQLFLVFVLAWLNVCISVEAGITSRYVRRLEASVGMPMDSDVFQVPSGYNAPQQVHITQGDHVGRAVIVSWVTPSEPASNTVLYGPEKYKYKYEAKGLVTRYKFYNYTSGYIHHCTVKSLEFDTKYFYKIGMGNTTRKFSFSTPPRPGPDTPYTFGIIGDLGQSFDSSRTFQHYLKTKGQTVLYVGDLSYADTYPFHDNRRWDTWGRFTEKSTAYQPWIWTAGNREIDFVPEIGEAQPFKPYRYRYHVPYRSSNSTAPFWYSIKRASAYMIVLSSYSAYGVAMARAKAASVAFMAALCICVIQLQGAEGAIFEILNDCSYTVWAAGTQGGGKQLEKGQSWTVQVPAGTPGQGAIWGRTGCSFGGSCITGDCGAVLDCIGRGHYPATAFEYSLNAPMGMDFFDISLVGGFNVPMSIIPSDYQCQAIACSSDINSRCPAELRKPDACMSACTIFNTTQCHQSNYTRFFKAQCPQAFSYDMDDETATFICTGGSDYKVVFCGAAASHYKAISIDCGGTILNHSNETNIPWVTDANYIDVGMTANTSDATLPSYLQRLRFFPKPLAKSCYQLHVAPNVPYLLRLWFAFGNYRRFQNMPSFAFSIETQGLLAVENVTFTGRHPINYERILVSSGRMLYICLIRTSETEDPFINAIELMTLRDGMYSQAKPGRMLSLLSRQYLSGTNSSFTDNFDRIWTSNINLDNSSLVRYVNATESILSNNTKNFPPNAVMQTACIINADSFELTIPTNYSAKSLLVLYFAETEMLNISESRSFYVKINGERRTETISTVMNYSMELSFISNQTNNFQFELVKANDSTRGPILNAYEFYLIYDTDKSTYSQDIIALEAVQRRIGIKGWLSDPCYLIKWKGIGCDNRFSPMRISEINLSGTNLKGSVPEDIGQLTALVNLSLDNNQLMGPLPNFSNLTMLERLHLQNNNLSGSFPDWLSKLKNLIELFIENNNFNGIIPAELQKHSLNLTYSGNRYLCMHKEECEPISKKAKSSVVIGITISGALIMAVALMMGIAVYWKKFRTKEHLNAGDHLMIMVPNPTKSRPFTLQEIEVATQKFSRNIGQGGFGSVFFGKLPDGKDIAVKVLSLFSREGVHQFQNEVDLLSKIHHKNLVSLLGYCNESKEIMLIYEYMSQGCLREHIYGPRAELSHLNWKTRLKIALDAAKGLEYLHVGCTPKIIHRDVKTANILLDSNMNGKLADFGLSKMTINDEASHVTTAVKGTIGYLDPDYFRTHMLTEKSDVYSFGVVLLEIICGRPPINTSLPEDELNLLEWVTRYVEMDENLGDIAVIIDKRLDGNFDMKSINGIVKLAFRCVEGTPSCRPSVSEVVREIKEAIAIEDENLQAAPVPSRVGSRPREMEWDDNSSNLPQVGR